MRCVLYRYFVLIALCTSVPVIAFSQELDPLFTDKPVAIIDAAAKLVSADSKSFLVQEVGLGKVKKYPAQIAGSDGDVRKQGSASVLVAALAEWNTDYILSPTARASFLFYGSESSEFVGTPVQTWRKDDRDQSTKRAELLAQEASQNKQQLKKAEEAYFTEEQKAEELQEKISLIAGVDEIMGLRG